MHPIPTAEVLQNVGGESQGAKCALKYLSDTTKEGMGFRCYGSRTRYESAHLIRTGFSGTCLDARL